MYQRLFGASSGTVACRSCGDIVITDPTLCHKCQPDFQEEEKHAPDELLILDNDQVFLDLFEKQKSLFWSDTELVFSQDATDLNKLPPKARKLFEYILAFFAFADGEVLENAVLNFLIEAESTSIRMAYTAQAFFESIHIKTYDAAMKSYIPDPDKRMKMALSFKTDPLLQERDAWMNKHISKKVHKAKRIIAFCCAEGLFFMSAFMVISWLRNLELFPMFARANEFISKDEWQHVQLGAARFKKFYSDDNLGKEGITKEDIFKIVKEAVDLEIKFASSLIPSESDTDKFEGFNLEHLIIHIQNLGNEILRLSGFREKLWDVDLTELPQWTKWIEIQPKNSFYETKVASYTIAMECSEDPERDIDY